MAANPLDLPNDEVITPGLQHFQVTPSDTVDLPVQPKAIYVNTSGTLVIVDENGAEVTYNVAAGAILPFRARRIKSTGTSAQAILWL